MNRRNFFQSLAAIAALGPLAVRRLPEIVSERREVTLTEIWFSETMRVHDLMRERSDRYFQELFLEVEERAWAALHEETT